MLSTASRVALTGAGVVGGAIATVFATTWDVSGCPVPDGSLLAYAQQTNSVWYQDCFQTRVSMEALRSVGRARTTDAFVQAFFRSPPMQLERKILGSASSKVQPKCDEKIKTMEFVESDSVAVFTVIMRVPDEVLMEAPPPFETLSFFSARFVPSDNEVELLFGTALQGGGFHGLPFHQFAITRLLTPFHILYSRVLLSQAKATMIADAQAQATK